jgi:hypothetical protein
MASTYSDLKIELIATGEQSGTWGTTTNTNLGTALEEAVVGRATANFTTDADLTISLTDTNATQVARHYILNVTSGVSLSTTRNLIVPTIDKPYIIENNTTGGQSIVVKTTAGTGVTVPNGKTMMVYANSTDVVPAFNFVPVSSGGTGQTTYTDGQLLIGNSSGNTLTKATLTQGTGITITNGNGSITIAATGGDVVGPASATDNAIARFDGTTGKLIQNSAVTVADTSGDITGGKYNKVTITAPATGATLTIADGKTATVNNSITLAGTDATTMTFPSTSQTIAGLAAAQTLTNKDLTSSTNTFPSSLATLTGTQTLTNKDLTSSTNTFPSSLATLTGTETLTNKTLTDPAIIGTILEDVFTITDGADFEIDPGNGSIQLIELGANRTPKATNFAAGEAITLMVDDGTAYTLTWTDATWGGSGVVWLTDSGVAPTLSTTDYTAIVLWKVASQVYGARVGNN